MADVTLREPTSRDGRRVLSCKSQRYEKLRVGGEKRFLEVRSKLCHLLAVSSWVPPGIPRILWIQATNTASSTQSLQQTSAKARTPNSAHGLAGAPTSCRGTCPITMGKYQPLRELSRPLDPSLNPEESRISLVVQWLRLLAPKAGGLGLITGQGNRSHMPQLKILCATMKT